MADVTLTAWLNVKTKEKNVPIQEAVVSRTAKGWLTLQKGHDGKGNKLTALLGEAKLAGCNQSWTCKTRLVNQQY